jgi:hypothetical protein
VFQGEILRDRRNSLGEYLRLANIVNIAFALKRLDKLDEAAAVVEGEDWTASRIDFQIALAVFEDDLDEAFELVSHIRSQGSENLIFGLASWPVFHELREDSRFAEAYKAASGKEYVSSSEVRRRLLGDDEAL